MVDVIVPTRSSRERLSGLVRQIEETAGVPVVVHVTGCDGSAAVNRNAGLDLAVRGRRSSADDLVAMVDDDVEFFLPRSRGWLRRMLLRMSRPEVVMVSAQLHRSDGKFAYMTGLQDCGLEPRLAGETVVPSRRLLTACCAFKPSGCRFDESFVGSGFEDIDFCRQLAIARPDGVFVVCHAAGVVHRNECKEQGGENWDRNLAHYEGKWGPLETPEQMLALYGPGSPASRQRAVR